MNLVYSLENKFKVQKKIKNRLNKIKILYNNFWMTKMIKTNLNMYNKFRLTTRIIPMDNIVQILRVIIQDVNSIIFRMSKFIMMLNLNKKFRLIILLIGCLLIAKEANNSIIREEFKRTSFVHKVLVIEYHKEIITIKYQTNKLITRYHEILNTRINIFMKDNMNKCRIICIVEKISIMKDKYL